MNIDIYIIENNKVTIENLERIKKIMNENNYNLNINYITSPTKEDIENNINDYIKFINLNSNEIDDIDFKNLQSKFSYEQLSNLFKHKKAYEMIKDKNNNNHNFIIQDNVILLDNENKINFNDFINKLYKIDYDIIFTSSIFNNNYNDSIDYLLSPVYIKILKSTNSYFINKITAEKLYEYLNIIRFNINLSLSKYVYDNRKFIKSYVLNKHTLIDNY